MKRGRSGAESGVGKVRMASTGRNQDRERKGRLNKKLKYFFSDEGEGVERYV